MLQGCSPRPRPGESPLSFSPPTPLPSHVPPSTPPLFLSTSLSRLHPSHLCFLTAPPHPSPRVCLSSASATLSAPVPSASLPASLSPPLRPSVPFSASLPVRSLVRPGPATRWPPRPRRPRVGKTARARAPRRRRRAAGAARREGRPGAVAGGGGGGDRDPRPTRPAAGDAGVPSPCRPGARPARSAELTPAASQVAAPRVQGPNRARREATAAMGKGEPAPCLHTTGEPFHLSPLNGTSRLSLYMQPS